jgi:hypothetical protein
VTPLGVPCTMSEQKDLGVDDAGFYNYVSKVSVKPPTSLLRKSSSLPDTTIEAYLAVDPARQSRIVKGSRLPQPKLEEFASKLARPSVEELKLEEAPSSSLTPQEEENQIVEVIISTFERYQDTFQSLIDEINVQVRSLNLCGFKQQINLKNFCDFVVPALLPIIRVPDYGVINQFQDIVKLEKSERSAKNSELAEHCSNFVELATRYGEIIVSEKRATSKHSKSIKVC